MSPSLTTIHWWARLRRGRIGWIMENSAHHTAIFLNALICRSPAGLRPRLEGLEAVVESGDGDLGVGGGPRRVDDADEGERVLQHHRDDGGQLQAVGLQHQLQ